MRIIEVDKGTETAYINPALMEWCSGNSWREDRGKWGFHIHLPSNLMEVLRDTEAEGQTALTSFLEALAL